MRKRFVVFGSIMMVLAGASRVRAQVSVPFEYEDVRLYVPVRAGDVATQWLVLDTGAAPTVLDVSFAAKLDANVTGTSTTSGAGRNRTRQQSASGIPLMVGGVRLTPPTVTILALDSLLARFSGRRVPGIVGSQFFNEHVVELDFDRREMRLYDPKSYRYDGKGIVIPIEIQGGVPIVQTMLTLPDGRAVPARMIVDLGAKATLLVCEPFMERNNVRASLAKSVRATLGAGVGGETRYDFARVRALDVGPGKEVRLENFVAGFSAEGTLRATSYDALLGAAFLQRYRVIFDYERSRMILEPRAGAAASSEFDMSGLYVTANGADLRKFIVYRVVPNSPASDADVRVGDQILKVNGSTSPAITLSALRDVLRSGPNRIVQIEVLRGEERLARDIRLRLLV